MAFEANECLSSRGGARILQRLIQTNLIYGAYSVAEKYIDLLEQTLYYKDWARDHRRFLRNDDALMADSLLSLKRKCIPASNRLSETQVLPFELEQIARQNPAHKASIQYAGALYLLAKEILLFEQFVEKNYKTECLPKLPETYQEAILILSEQDPAYLKKYAIAESVILRYNDFRKQVLANRNNAKALPGLLKNSFGKTYWYYYMFK